MEPRIKLSGACEDNRDEIDRTRALVQEFVTPEEEARKALSFKRQKVLVAHPLPTTIAPSASPRGFVSAPLQLLTRCQLWFPCDATRRRDRKADWVLWPGHVGISGIDSKIYSNGGAANRNSGGDPRAKDRPRPVTAAVFAKGMQHWIRSGIRSSSNKLTWD